MKLLLTIATLMIFISGCSQNLKISENGRFIEKDNGKPFLWIGDTAWELFHKLDREESTDYLTTRAEQGFTLIQAVVLAENDGLKKTNSFGEVPFIDLDPTKPNEAYFKHVDFIVDKANELGMVVGILPTWGDKVFSMHPADGPIVFNKQNAVIYGEFLGKRYKNKVVVWILGGDRDVANNEVLDIWRAMARGLRKGDGGRHLITYHPRGGSSSSDFLHNETWLDFNMYQSGHGERFNKVYRYAETDYLKKPIKPSLDGEPAYEAISVKFWEYLDFKTVKKVPDTILNSKGIIKDTSYFKEGFFKAYDVRIHGYWNFLSGACGYTYGNNAVWQMFKKGGNIAIPCIADWRESLQHDGANQLRHLKTIFELYPISKLVPDQSIVYGINRNDENHIRAAKSTDGDWLLVYLSKGQKVSVVMSKVEAKNIIARWYNPRNGEFTPIGNFLNKGTKEFTPPTNGTDNDWLLVLEVKK